jgi:hypothetical protein
MVKTMHFAGVRARAVVAAPPSQENLVVICGLKIQPDPQDVLSLAQGFVHVVIAMLLKQTYVMKYVIKPIFVGITLVPPQVDRAGSIAESVLRKLVLSMRVSFG